MEKSFDPKTVEAKWRRFWEDSGIFTADPRSTKPPFCMVIPPPNITGRLHVGHGLNNTLQDVLARWKRMSGYDVLWVPGSDHASIGTHVMIEKSLAEEGLTRQQLGREKFLERATKWREKYGREITEQLRQLGVSCDWTRERFTMDPGLSAAVREVFVRLYEEGLIYRDRYLINWCPRCATAVSDLEVVHREMQGKIWTVAYKLEGGGAIEVATTRPETILGDVAVAVHPDDARYRALVGRSAILPVTGRLIPIVSDAFVDPSFGSGAVKVTPAHDPNDFLAGARLGLTPIVVMDEHARMNDAAGPYAGMDRFECRTRLLEQLSREGLLISEKDHQLSVGRCERCDTIVEPLISLQWFVRIEPLAAPALAAVEQGRVALIPDQWRKTYYEWMRNIRDWCISRQLWWGHRIPAWYCADCNATIVSRHDPTACSACGGGGRLTQDPDILDTWFSSGLWAFSTLGWPEKTPELSRYYPTTVLVTGYDIIFFWVARMIMLGIKFMGDVPFHAVFFNGLVRDASGRKMSKTRGNTIDLFEMLETYGTDAVRFTYAALSTPGSDVPLAPGRLDGSRAFANKIWNAVRFARPHLPEGDLPPLPGREALALADRWILSRVSRLAGDVNQALADYRFDEASSLIYRFAWHELCDWYLEISKPALLPPRNGEDGATAGAEAAATRTVLSHVLNRLLRLLHPMMPFLTEELWANLPQLEAGRSACAVAPFPQLEPSLIDDGAEQAMDLLMETVTRIRNLRAEMRIEPAARVVALLKPAGDGPRRQLETLAPQLTSLARLTRLQFVTEFPQGIPAARAVARGVEIALPLEGLLDVNVERLRLTKEIDKSVKELSGHEAKLANQDFLARAKPEAIQKAREAQREISDRITKLRSVLETIAGPGSP